MSKQIHYNIDIIDKENANYNLIYGEKSNGKSYQVKHKKAVKKYLATGRRFILMRRWSEDLTSSWIEQYFSDVDITGLTNNKYQKIKKFRNELYLTTVTEDFKEKKRRKNRLCDTAFVRTKIFKCFIFRCRRYNIRRIYVKRCIYCK